MKEQISTTKSQFILRELNAIIAVIAREITIFFKSPAMIIMTLVMPIFMMGMI